MLYCIVMYTLSSHLLLLSWMFFKYKYRSVMAFDRICKPSRVFIVWQAKTLSLNNFSFVYQVFKYSKLRPWKIEIKTRSMGIFLFVLSWYSANLHIQYYRKIKVEMLYHSCTRNCQMQNSFYYCILKRKRTKQTRDACSMAMLAYSGCEYIITFNVCFQVFYERQIQ